MRSSLSILICCLYALSTIAATPFSNGGQAEVQQDNAKATEPQNFWSNDKNDNDDHDKGGKIEEAGCRVDVITTLVPGEVVTNTVTTLVPSTLTVTTLVPSTTAITVISTFTPTYTALGCHAYNFANDASDFLVKREFSLPPLTPAAEYAYTYNECANTCALAPNQHFQFFSVAYTTNSNTPPAPATPGYVCSCYNQYIDSASTPITGCTVTLAIPVGGATDYKYGTYKTDENLFQLTT